MKRVALAVFFLASSARADPPVEAVLDGGYGVRSLERLPVHGAELGIAVGARPIQPFAVYGEARLFLGSSEEGLRIRSARFAGAMNVVVDRFRFIFDPGLFVVGLDRATVRSQTISTSGPSLGVAVRVDAWRTNAFAFFVRVAGDAGITFSDGSIYGGVTFGAGADFDVTQ